MIRLIAGLLVFACCASGARADDPWAQSPHRGWFARQMQPDVPAWSCCGDADAYYADRFELKDGKFFAIVTDDRDDVSRGRPHMPIGTRIEIPSHKFNDPRPDPNPTGHGLVFVSSRGVVFCYYNPPIDG